MEKAGKAMFVSPEQQGSLTAYGVDEAQQKKYEEHRDVLVTRGVLFKRVYVFENVRSTTETAKAVLKTLLRSPPCPVIDFSSPHTDESRPLEITLWGMQKDKQAWDKFVRDHDTPAQRSGAANRSQPVGSETNRTPSTAGSGG